MKKLPLHSKIVIGLVLGLSFGLVSIFSGLPPSITIHYIKPVGVIFVNALKMIAVPLIIASLIVGVANLGDISKLSRMGSKTIALYIFTTAIATTIGLFAVNLIKPGQVITSDTREQILEMYSGQADETTDRAVELKEKGPLDPLIKMVPVNFFNAASNNNNMLQVVFFSLIFGVALLKVPKDKSKTVVAFFKGANEVILTIIHFIMALAPYGVFALMAALIVELAGDNPSKSIFKIFTRVKYKTFFKGIREAQLLAFSTSSSSATLPVTMECVEENLGVSEEVTSFVLPLGATINMDGTSLYQSVAAVFIAQAMGIELTIGNQLMIVLTATLASIGSAGVPGAGMVMLVIVLEAIGIPAAGLALIIAPDRLLDMCRTVVNVSGDATVAMTIASSEGEKVGSEN
jgi:Na+/H+-dicarboxylate symporter